MQKTKLKLSTAERERLENLIGRGTAKAREIKHAQVLLKLNAGWKQVAIAEAFDLTQRTVVRLKQRYESEGVEAALVDKARSGAPKRYGKEAEVAVTTLACTPAPEGHSSWTLHLLAAKVVELAVLEEISPSTVGRLLKKTNSSRGRSGNGAFQK